MYIKRLYVLRHLCCVMLFCVITVLVGIAFFCDTTFAKDTNIICPIMEDVISEEEETVSKIAVSANTNITQMVEEVNQSMFYEVILNEEYEEKEISSNKGSMKFSKAVTNNILYEIPIEKQISTSSLAIEDKTSDISVMTINEYNLQIKYGITEDELELFERIIQAEAGGQGLKGKILVANVILNRVHSKKFPNSIKGVIMAPGQFSPVSNGRIWTVRVDDETRKAVRKALDGEDYSQGALYFMARSASNPGNVTWFDRALTRLFRHGGHEFFK